jgi:hypothetical protein
VACRGSNATPHTLILRFPEGAVIVGNGYETIPGDGDDVIVLPEDATDPTSLPDLFWRARENTP